MAEERPFEINQTEPESPVELLVVDEQVVESEPVGDVSADLVAAIMQTCGRAEQQIINEASADPIEEEPITP